MTSWSRPLRHFALLCLALLLQPMSIVHAGDQWTLLATDSRLQFTATYDQSPFDGRFEFFEVALVFDPEQPEKAALIVRVKLSSLNTENDDRDIALADPEWFDFKHHPWSEFRANGFARREANHYVADGQLRLKGITRPLRLLFDWTELENNRASLSGAVRMAGSTIINRLEFDIGSGEWADESLIGQRIEVRFDLLLERSSN